MTDYESVQAGLDANGVPCLEQRIGPQHFFVVPRYGAHFLGPFDSRSGEAAFWLSDVFADSGRLGEFIARGEWNLGGVRFWIAPEIQFGVRERAHYWDSLYVQRCMEPGDYSLSRDAADNLVLSGEMDLECHNLTRGHKRLTVKRILRAEADPLALVPGFQDHGLDYFGFAHESELTGDPKDRTSAEAWNLVQVKAGGKAIIPITGKFSYLDYYEPVDAEHLSVAPGRAELKLDGRRRFKLGVHSHCHYGRMGYLRRAGSEAELLVANYHNVPSNPYAEQPADQPDCRGLSMHFYNDGGMFGGFAELEANGLNLGDPVNRGITRDVFRLWRWRGSVDAVEKAAALLLGGV